MVSIGRVNRLDVTRKSASHFYLDGGKFGEIPLPRPEAPADCRLGVAVNAFVYLDDEGYLIACAAVPTAQVGDVAWLKVAQMDGADAFLDWGFRDLLPLPREEQPGPVKLGQYCMVKVFLDQEYGITASCRLDDFVLDTATEFTQGQKVALLVGNETDLGVNVVVNDRYWGLLHEADIFQPLRKGQRLEGYIKKLRTDNKLDISLSAPGYAKVDSIAEGILAKLQENQGFMAVSDKSDPELIYSLFGVSKKAFKQAIGALYKERRISIEEGGIRLV